MSINWGSRFRLPGNGFPSLAAATLSQAGQDMQCLGCILKELSWSEGIAEVFANTPGLKGWVVVGWHGGFAWITKEVLSRWSCWPYFLTLLAGGSEERQDRGKRREAGYWFTWRSGGSGMERWAEEAWPAHWRLGPT